MKKWILCCLLMFTGWLTGCAETSRHPQQSSAAIQQKMQNAAVAQQLHQTGLQSQSTYFGSGNYNTLPNTLR